MEPYAEACFVLKVNVHCQACKMKMMEALGSICGVYDVDINTEEGLARVKGVVEPNILLKALARTDKHAEVKWVKLRHPKMSRISDYEPYYGYRHGHGYDYGATDHPYSYRRALPDYASNHYAPYYYGSDPYYGSGLPPARYVPSFPHQEYDPYDDERISFCSIMWSYEGRRPRSYHF